MVLYMLSLNACKALKWASTVGEAARSGTQERYLVADAFRIQGIWVVTEVVGKDEITGQYKMRRDPSRMMEHYHFRIRKRIVCRPLSHNKPSHPTPLLKKQRKTKLCTYIP